MSVAYYLHRLQTCSVPPKKKLNRRPPCWPGINKLIATDLKMDRAELIALRDAVAVLSATLNRMAAAPAPVAAPAPARVPINIPAHTRRRAVRHCSYCNATTHTANRCQQAAAARAAQRPIAPPTLRIVSSLQDCPVCMDNKMCCEFQCGHNTCATCIDNMNRAGLRPNCPLCRAQIVYKYTH